MLAIGQLRDRPTYPRRAQACQRQALGVARRLTVERSPVVRRLTAPASQLGAQQVDAAAARLVPEIDEKRSAARVEAVRNSPQVFEHADHHVGAVWVIAEHRADGGMDRAVVPMEALSPCVTTGAISSQHRYQRWIHKLAKSVPAHPCRDSRNAAHRLDTTVNAPSPGLPRSSTAETVSREESAPAAVGRRPARVRVRLASWDWPGLVLVLVLVLAPPGARPQDPYASMRAANITHGETFRSGQELEDVHHIRAGMTSGQ